MKLKYEIIYEDSDVIMVNKPPFMLAIPDRYDPLKPNLKHSLKKKFEEVFVVHRIDKETSGIICFAKNEAAHKNLSKQFEERTTQKIYHTLVEGKMHQTEGVIDKPIAASTTQSGKMVIHDRGKPSVTNYKVIEEFKQYSLVEADIKTGRTHQIRVHFESIGYPLAIDSVYGRKEEFNLSDIKLRRFNLKKGTEERPLMKRSTLHAYSLEIDHPTTGERVKFTADMPKDFRAVLQQLRKWGK